MSAGVSAEDRSTPADYRRDHVAGNVVADARGWEVRLNSHQSSLSVTTPASARQNYELGYRDYFDGDVPGSVQRYERVRSGLLPSFFNMNVKSPALGGLSGSARVSLTPHNRDSCGSYCEIVFAGMDVQEMFFSEHKIASGFSPARTRSLFQRKNTWSASPRFEAQASYAKNFSNGSVNFWLGGTWQEAEYLDGPLAGTDTASKGLRLGTQATIGGLELGLSYFQGEALSNTLVLDADAVEMSSVDGDNGGFLAQGSYRFNSARTRVGISYGAAKLDGAGDESCTTGRSSFTLSNACASARRDVSGKAPHLRQSAWTLGVYHDVTSWLKFVAEYTNSETEWTGGENEQLDTFAIGGFFSW